MTTDTDALVEALDAVWENTQGSGHRYHLGASIIGRSCAREVWYKFWWVHAVRHTGRLLRLFNRGHREEAHAVENLRKLGAIVEDVDENGKQVKFSRLWGLFGGERDGAISNLEEFGFVGKGLLEFKTHGEKSFKNLQNKGLLSAKPEHFIQMQLYMHWSGFEWGLYYAVNKNTDELYIAYVPYRPDIAEQYTERARTIIESTLPPKRISDDPSWYVCKFCDFKRICHEDAEVDQNCRTCEHIDLRVDGDEHGWYCRHWCDAVPKDFTWKGCDQWTRRTGL